jgi:hypothetical protein
MSSFTWLDYSERDQERMLDAIRQLFEEQDTRDELGISRVRDAFSDLFFPGISTIQTRARYFLFIPWIYLQLEEERVSSREISRQARRREAALIDALDRAGAQEGLIGIQARGALQRLPSSIYWNGLGVWGIRLFPGSQGAYHHSLDHFYNYNRQISAANEQGEEAETLRHNWHTGLPSHPPGFLRGATFQLTLDEANYLREQILRNAPGTLLAFLVEEGAAEQGADIRFPWKHPLFAEMPAPIQEQLVHARNFSETMHGAALLYNLMLAEAARHEEWELHYQDRLQVWASRLDDLKYALTEWSWRTRFWEIVAEGSDTIPFSTRRFIDSWLEIVLQSAQAHEIAGSQEARKLISEREWLLKRKRARLHNKRALEMWSGAAGTARLNYRWGNARAILDDILKGLSQTGRRSRESREAANA